MAKIARRVDFQFGTQTHSTSVELLLSLERLIYFKSRQSSVDLMESSGDLADLEPAPDILINLAGEPTPDTACSLNLTPLFDGIAGEEQLFAALLNGRAPVIEIAGPQREVLSSAVPALDQARCITDGYERVIAIVQSLLIRAVANPEPPDTLASRSQRVPHAEIGIVTYGARMLASAAIRRAYQLCMFSPHWRVGWRYLTDQNGVWERQSLDGVPWSSIGDPGFRFYADPFPITHQGKTCVLVEDFDHREGKGVISAIPFDAQGPSGPAQRVLTEPWHLSYPFVFEYRGAVWMMPESSETRKISLYRAEVFPSRWVHEADLLDNIDAHDASIVQHDGKWWIFATVRDGIGGIMDGLALFHADDLLGPWSAHAGNPVMIDAEAARQGGQFVTRAGKLWRPVQDCNGGYGRALGLAEVTVLSEIDFEQCVRKVLRPDSSWPGRRLHTLNRFGNLECIDGSRNSPKFGGFLGSAVTGWRPH